MTTDQQVRRLMLLIKKVTVIHGGHEGGHERADVAQIPAGREAAE